MIALAGRAFVRAHSLFLPCAASFGPFVVLRDRVLRLCRFCCFRSFKLFGSVYLCR
jgi:hypothetical protein